PVAQQLDQSLTQYDGQPTPAIIPIPSNTRSLNIGMDRIHKNVEKAIGMNILDDD
ncbi:V-type ATP synthase subunit F, partial [Lactiplantibacillus plantarum]|uniref:V-type ATP synthase subunit F n=1 Tax=Lactiplantibacillus plantarum TaxID=1590 RepID=UPI003C213ABC